MPLTAVLFDLDDTLVDHTSAVARGIDRHLDRVLPGCDVAAATAEWHRLESVHHARHLAGELTWQGQRRARVVDLLAFLGQPVPPDDDTTDSWFEGYRAAFEQATLAFAETVSVLDELSVPVGIVSNNDAANVRAKLERTGLGGRFDLVLCPVAEGLPAKPAPELFLAGTRALGSSDPAGTAYVGDRLETDAVGARDAGLVGVWLDRRGDGSGALPERVVRIPDLRALPGLVTGWPAASAVG